MTTETLPTITSYEIRRSGPGMTIAGKHMGEPFTLTGVVRIKSAHHVGPETGHMAVPVAETKDGRRFALV